MDSAWRGDADSICLVDSGLQSLDDAPLHGLLRHINAHCNAIRTLRGLEMVRGLVSLDVSANQLISMQGVECLTYLRTLNVSCNKIKALEGLEQLQALRWLDASHNEISCIANLSSAQCGSLETLHINGNRLRSSEHILQHLAAVKQSLRHVYIWAGSGDSAAQGVRGPLAHSVWLAFPELTSLNGVTCNGQPAHPPQQSDYLATESFPAFTTSLFADERSHLDSYISTPHIDEVLSKLAGSRTGSCENPSGSESLSNRSIPVPAKKCGQHLEVESSDSSPSPSTSPVPKQVPVAKGISVESDSKLHGQTKMGTGMKRVSAKRGPVERQPARERKDDKPAVVVVRHARPLKVPSAGSSSLSSSTETAGVATSRHAGESTEESVIDDRQKTPHVSKEDAAVSKDACLKEEVERRVKAEHALQLLTSTVQRLQGEVNMLKTTGVRWKQQWVQAKSHLQSVVQEAEAIRNEVKKEQEMTIQLKAQLATQSSDSAHEIAALKEQCASAETCHGKELAAQKEENQRLNLLCTTYQQDAEAMRATLAAQSSQSQFLQTMLGEMMNREKSSVPEELQRLLSERREPHREPSETAYTALVEQLRKEVEEKEKQYKALEDEFRGALRIEAGRYQELQVCTEDQTLRLGQMTDALRKSEAKEKQATAMVSRLTTVLREQQDKVRSLTQERLEAKTPSEVRAGYECQVASLEATVVALKDELQRSKDEHLHLDGTLRKERLDLEMQLSKASALSNSLRLQLQEANESLLIKSKMLDDQNAAIREMKEKSAKSKSSHSEETRCMAAQVQQLEENLASVSISHQELQDEVEALQERKKQLKTELATASSQLQDFDAACNGLQEELAAKEISVANQNVEIDGMRDAEAQLAQKIQALMEAGEERERAHQADMQTLAANLREELATKSTQHTDELRAVKEVHENLLRAAENRVREVEQEMRDLLHEQEQRQSHVHDVLQQLNSLVVTSPDPAQGHAATTPVTNRLNVSGVNQPERHRHSAPLDPGRDAIDKRNQYRQQQQQQHRNQQPQRGQPQQHLSTVAPAADQSSHPKSFPPSDSHELNSGAQDRSSRRQRPYEGSSQPRATFSLEQELQQKLLEKQGLIERLQKLNAAPRIS